MCLINRILNFLNRLVIILELSNCQRLTTNLCKSKSTFDRHFEKSLIFTSFVHILRTISHMLSMFIFYFLFTVFIVSIFYIVHAYFTYLPCCTLPLPLARMIAHVLLQVTEIGSPPDVECQSVESDPPHPRPTTFSQQRATSVHCTARDYIQTRRTKNHPLKVCTILGIVGREGLEPRKMGPISKFNSINYNKLLT